MDGRDEDDDEEYEEEGGGGNRLLGFMFGNVGYSGDLDVDYLDEDAKEHLSALADKLGPSLTDIDLSKTSPGPTDAYEQDYDQKAEDAIDYEDIDEQYDGPETQASTEEDHLLSKKEYFSSDAMLLASNHKASVFDEENYDEDEEIVKEDEVAEKKFAVEPFPSEGEQLELVKEKEINPDDNFSSARSTETEDMAFAFEDFQDEPDIIQDHIDSKSDTSLPVLCVEDGLVILKFSEIFGIHEPLKKAERKGRYRHSTSKDWVKTVNVADIIEEDEEDYLRNSFSNLLVSKYHSSSLHDVEDSAEQKNCGFNEPTKDSCLCAQPMKIDMTLDMSAGRRSPLCPRFYPFDQQDWEDEIIWDNSPATSHGHSESCVISEVDAECHSDAELDVEFGQLNVGPDGKDFSLCNNSVVVESFGSRNLSIPPYSDRSYHPQILRLESISKQDNMCSADKTLENGKTADVCRSDSLRRFSKISLQNKDLLEGSWLNQIIWDPDDTIPKPKLILDLQDEQMLFEILDPKDGDHLRCHAGAMVVTPSSKGVSYDPHSQAITSIGRFNISNDKYYSSRKTSQQAKSHAKKRASLGVKVMHSVPALKLQTIKLKLSNKDIANFHRPKALWYPHENEFVAKSQGTLSACGPMHIILMSLGGKGIKLNVNAEEDVSSVKLKAYKKLDFNQSEKVKVFYSGKELDDDKSFASQNVLPNSVLHLIRTKIHLWPRAQKLPGENKPLRPPGAFKKKSELSVKDGHVFLMEYCEERPLLIGNVGMGARLCTYYQKMASGDQTASSLRNDNNGLGSVITLDPTDKSPFLGDISPGCCQSSLETNMYRAPIFQHKVSTTDYLLVRSAKGILSLRRIDKLYVVGQQEPHMEVLSPGSKNAQTYLWNRMLLYLYREFRAKEKPGVLPCVRVDELTSQFPSFTDALVRKRLKHCADLQKFSNGQLYWVKRQDFRIPSEEELRRTLTPENVCSYESMLAGLYRLKHLGINRLTQPVGLSSAMNQLPDEAIALAAASHIERELQITSWNLTSNFVACTNQDRENIERLEITGVGDPSGRGMGFSYVRVTPKAPVSSAAIKKKAGAARGSSAVTGTDADLRRLSMDAAREVLLKFNVPEEQIDKLTRWHRIAMVRKLSSEQAESGVKVDATTLNKFARGQRMSFLQLQQQTREKCQDIWDRQLQSLSAADGDENDSDSEANSDLDSFAGDLENLLDAEACEEEEVGNTDSKRDNTDGVRGFKMRRCPSQAQTEEGIEDDEAEAAVIRRLLDGNENKKKKKKPIGIDLKLGSHFGPENADSVRKSYSWIKQINSVPRPDGKEVEKFHTERNVSHKVNSKKGNGRNDGIPVLLVKKKITSVKDKIFKEKKHFDKPVREGFACGACGQWGHMRTNKNCPKYKEDVFGEKKVEDVETAELESLSGKYHNPDVVGQLHLKTPIKKLASKVTAKVAEVEVPENVDKRGPTQLAKVKFKCGPSDRTFDKSLQNIADAETETKPIGKINKLTFYNTKPEDVQHEMQKSSALWLPSEAERDQPRKKIIIKPLKGITIVEQVTQDTDTGLDHEPRKMKKIVELSSYEKQKKQEVEWHTEETIKRTSVYDRRLQEEGEKRKSKESLAEDRTMRVYEERRKRYDHQRFLGPRRYEEPVRNEEIQKPKKKKKPDFQEDYSVEYRSYRNDRRIPERAAKRRAVVDMEQGEYALSTKRRRGGEVVLSNLLESIVDNLMKENQDVTYLFVKPVSKKEAPDYHHIIDKPMDLSTIREKARKLEYKSREDFRHDVWQITYNAHKYNDGRNHHIPPLADQLLEICDELLQERDMLLSDAEAGIKT